MMKVTMAQKRRISKGDYSARSEHALKRVQRMLTAV